MLVFARNNEHIAAFDGELPVVNGMYGCAAQNDDQLVEPVNVQGKLRLRITNVNLQRQCRIFEIVLFFQFFGHGVIVLNNVCIVKELSGMLCYLLSGI